MSMPSARPPLQFSLYDLGATFGATPSTHHQRATSEKTARGFQRVSVKERSGSHETLAAGCLRCGRTQPYCDWVRRQTTAGKLTQQGPSTSRSSMLDVVGRLKPRWEKFKRPQRRRAQDMTLLTVAKSKAVVRGHMTKTRLYQYSYQPA